jgi:TrmH family RNA methyltransferase
MTTDSDRVPLLGRHNPRLQRLRRIARGQEPGLTVVDGIKLAVELAGRGVPLHEVYASPDQLRLLEDDPRFARLFRSGRVFAAEPASLEHVAPTRAPQGLLAVVEIPERTVPPTGVVLYLDRVQDPGNVGGAIRCAAAFGATGVLCSPGCADPFSPRAVRSSAGHSLLLPVGREAGFGPIAAAVTAAGGDTVATAGLGGVPLPQWQPRLPLLLALGNEGQGLDPGIVAACRETVSIPLAAGVESLNVAVTAGVLLARLAGAGVASDGLAPAPILGLKDWKESTR